jgi:hypothetical protein
MRVCLSFATAVVAAIVAVAAIGATAVVADGDFCGAHKDAPFAVRIASPLPFISASAHSSESEGNVDGAAPPATMPPSLTPLFTRCGTVTAHEFYVDDRYVDSMLFICV